MRLAVYTDYSYHRVGNEIFAERAFALFLASLATHFEETIVLGRLDPRGDRARYPLGEDIEFVPLPFYPSLSQPYTALVGMARSLRQIWKTLSSVDCIWLLGPHPLAIPIALMATLRRCRLVLGVRQEFTEYVRNRHPGKRRFAALAMLMEVSFRALARSCSVIVVGPRIATSYRHSKRLLEIFVSLVSERDIAPFQSHGREYGDTLTILSVGRLDAEKNPLMLADALAALPQDRHWHLEVCGEGPLKGELEARLERLGVRDRATLHGYVPLNSGLRSLYERSHVLLHISWTEGIPQVLFEAFAAELPVVATDVGGIGLALPGAVRLIEAGNPTMAAFELERLCVDSSLRDEVNAKAHTALSEATLEREIDQVAAFIASAT